LHGTGQSPLPIALLTQALDLSLKLGDPLLRTLHRASQVRLAAGD
jgi:hypothetical protein